MSQRISKVLVLLPWSTPSRKPLLQRRITSAQEYPSTDQIDPSGAYDSFEDSDTSGIRTPSLSSGASELGLSDEESLEQYDGHAQTARQVYFLYAGRPSIIAQGPKPPTSVLIKQRHDPGATPTESRVPTSTPAMSRGHEAARDLTLVGATGRCPPEGSTPQQSIPGHRVRRTLMTARRRSLLILTHVANGSRSRHTWRSLEQARETPELAVARPELTIPEPVLTTCSSWVGLIDAVNGEE